VALLHAEVARQAAVRAAAAGSAAAGGGRAPTVLADGFSCRTQLDQLAGVRGTHLAELLASRLPENNSKKRQGPEA
jgi:hypothetical protein